MIIDVDGEKHVVFQLGETINELKLQVFQVTLENNSWNISETAKALGISVRTGRYWARQLEQETGDDE